MTTLEPDAADKLFIDWRHTTEPAELHPTDAERSQRTGARPTREDFPPPYYDDGSAGALATFAANTAALASGHLGGRQPPAPRRARRVQARGGTGFNSAIGLIRARLAVWCRLRAVCAHEGAGTETSVTQSYSAQILAPIPLVMVGCDGIARRRR